MVHTVDVKRKIYNIHFHLQSGLWNLNTPNLSSSRRWRWCRADELFSPAATRADRSEILSLGSISDSPLFLLQHVCIAFASQRIWERERDDDGLTQIQFVGARTELTSRHWQMWTSSSSSPKKKLKKSCRISFPQSKSCHLSP